MDFEIRGIRAGEWERFRELRLAALRDAPDAFGESYDVAVARPDEWWQERAAKGARPESRIIVAEARDGSWVGITRMALTDESTDEEPIPAEVDVLPVAEVLSVFVRPQWRGGGDPGVAARLIRETCEWARSEFGAVWAMLDVRADNGRALGFYRRLGFVDTGIRLPTDVAATAELNKADEMEIRMVRRI